MRSVIQRLAKRAIDVAAASAGLLLLSPVLAGAAAAIYVSMGRPIFFFQTRPGLKGAPFRMVKFRTMLPEKDPGAEGCYRSDNERLTKVGRFLRSSSIDELPELFNVLLGDMSLVGPRPWLMEYLPKYSAEQFRRHDMPPGITGWAQVHGRQNITFGQRIAHDLWYVDHWSLWLDLKIIAMTVGAVAKTSDVVSGQAVEDFDDIGLTRS